MKLNYDTILQRADELYAKEKLGPEAVRYAAPELLPKIQSDQVKCVLRALVEAFETNQTGGTTSN